MSKAHFRRHLSTLCGVTAVSLGLSLFSTASLACEAEEMATNEHGFILKVVAGSDKIIAYESEEPTSEAFNLGLLQPYFVICETGDLYRITDLPAATVDEAMTGNVGFVRKDQIFVWPTREALNYHALVFHGERPELVAWEDNDVLNDYMKTGDAKRFPPAFKEDLDSTLKRPRDIRPYPVLSSDTRSLRGRREKRVFRSLIPAALPPNAAAVIKDETGGVVEAETIKKVLSSASFAVVFDSTGSMEPIAVNVSRELIRAFESLDENSYSNSSIGFVFFRDEEDQEKVAMADLMPMKEGSNLLKAAAKRMDGGHDAAEPILDAVYLATHQFNWNSQGGGRQIIIGVLHDDAKPATTGKIDDRVPAGMDAAQVATQTREKGVSIITVQASADAGPNLYPVLSTLAEGTGGQFIEHGGATDIATAVAALMREAVVSEARAGEKIAEEIFQYGDYPAIPLTVLDGEHLERLRRAGLEYNIEDGRGGVLVREGYIIENPDLLEARIQINKETLQSLVNLYSVLGTTGVDAEAMVEAAGEAIAAIAGEDFDREEKISSIVQKKLGIQFRTNLLSFDLEFLAGLNSVERLAMTKRIQKAGGQIGHFLEANLDAFDRQPSVWMPMDQLP